MPTVRCDLCIREAMFRMPRDGGYLCLSCALTILRRYARSAESTGSRVRYRPVPAAIERAGERFSRWWKCN
jgi:hypothetical protein